MAVEMVIWGIMEIMVQFNVDNRYMKTRISLRLLQTYFVGAMALLAGCQQEMTEPEINQDNNREVPVVLTARQGILKTVSKRSATQDRSWLPELGLTFLSDTCLTSCFLWQKRYYRV